MDYKISERSFNEICYFIDDWLRLMGGGSEWDKLSKLIYYISTECPDFDFGRYYYINQALKYNQILLENFIKNK